MLDNGNLSGTASVTVGPNGTLGGKGTIANAVTIDGTLAPGFSAGALTFSSTLALGPDSLTVMEIGGTVPGTGHDQVNVSGVLTYGGALTLDFTAPAAFNSPYQLFALGATPTGNFSSVTLNGTYSGALVRDGNLWTGTSNGYDFSFSQVTGELMVIPEPAAYALLFGALGLGLVVYHRNRRR
jgi:hypothetical protein